MNYFDKKEELSKQAKEWREKMQADFACEIKCSIDNSSIYSPDIIYTFNLFEKEPDIEFMNCGTTEAVLALRKDNPGKKICALNFASYKNPGGMFLKGSSAQEERLCHTSTLYNVLESFESYYKDNRDKLNSGLYTNRAIYSPDIVFFDSDGNTVKCDVLTCAAPNKSLIRYKGFTETENSYSLEGRMCFMKQIVQEKAVDILVLGAWGCGVFKQDPAEVCKRFLNVFRLTTAERVVFAVPGNDINKQTFEDLFFEHIKKKS